MTERDSARFDVFGDPLPGGALSRCGTHRLWHPPEGDDGVPPEVSAACFSPDARRLVTAAGRTARVWDLEDGRELAVLSGHRSQVNAVLYLSATRIVTAGDDRTVRLWDADSGAELWQWRLECQGFSRLALSSDGRTLLVGLCDPSGFAVLDVATWTLRQWIRPEGSEGYTSSLSFSPDGSQVLLLERFGESLRICVFEAATWSLQWASEVVATEFPFVWAAFSADGQRVRRPGYVTGWRPGLYEYDARTGALLDIAPHRFEGRWVPLPDGTEVRIVMGRLVISRAGEPERWVNDLLPASSTDKAEPVVAPGGRWATLARGSAAVVLLDLHSRKVRPERAHRGSVRRLTFSRDGAKLLSHSWDGTLRTWACGSGRQLECVTPDWWRRSIDRIHLGGGRALEVESHYGAGHLTRDLLAGTEVNIKLKRGRSTLWSDDLAVVADLADHRVEGELTVHVHDTRTGARLRRMPIAVNRDVVQALSRTGRLLVTQEECRQQEPCRTELRVWNLARRGPPFRVLTIWEGAQTSSFSTPEVGFSPDEAWLVYRDARDVAILVDLACPERRIRLDPGARVSSVAFSEDSKRVATGDRRGAVTVWNMEGQRLGVLEGHRACVGAVAFSADGDFLASGSDDTTALIWPRSAWEQQGR
ncbi:WD40 repeat domain-containing protein [Pyxidicoccus xibeiensis]|uniref:WD40 repeat domain-containing protein n=1 Tax=Pyxidicoccus xibeiensis TaxID=2906759 RepID=UPI0020A74B47|nr:WD40 repeat domain-containing protein [Pyxidicoccus xibeiensis]MCP3136507.1 WD40 repeat domain-containing protein [Pyxidicoccus xibeiensis]